MIAGPFDAFLLMRFCWRICSRYSFVALADSLLASVSVVLYWVCKGEARQRAERAREEGAASRLARTPSIPIRQFVSDWRKLCSGLKRVMLVRGSRAHEPTKEERAGYTRGQNSKGVLRLCLACTL